MCVCADLCLYNKIIGDEIMNSRGSEGNEEKFGGGNTVNKVLGG